jgi:hypothetical protein
VKPPTLGATMERRILVSYRVDVDVLAEALPAPFRPLVVHGYGVAGICLIRLGDIRPAGLPAAVGLSCENAAHRIAVQWDGPDGLVTGVYVPRRDTSFRLAAVAGGSSPDGNTWHASTLTKATPAIESRSTAGTVVSASWSPPTSPRR